MLHLVHLSAVFLALPPNPAPPQPPLPRRRKQLFPLKACAVLQAALLQKQQLPCPSTETIGAQIDKSSTQQCATKKCSRQICLQAASVRFLTTRRATPAHSYGIQPTVCQVQKNEPRQPMDKDT